jgi:general secretion pathway protein D
MDEESGDFQPPPMDSPDDSSSGSSMGSSPSLPSAKSPLPPTGAGQPNKSAPVKKVPPGQELVSIDFPEPTEIKDIIKAVGQWTGKNFILKPGISAKVAIISPQQVTKEEAYQAFLSALNVAGFTTVDTGKVVKIIPTTKATGSNIKTFYGSSWAPMTDEIITQIIPLNYIDASTVANQLRTILRETSIVPFTTTNSLIASDTGHKIRRLLEIVRLLDVKGNQPQVAIVPIKNTDATDISRKVQEVFGSRAGANSLYLQKVLVDERTNSLLLIGPPRGLNDVIRLIKRLDRPLEDQGSQAQIHVRQLDYADAEKLAAVLQALTSSAGNRGTGTTFRPVTPVAPRPGTNGRTGTNGGTSVAVADLGGTKITADKATNSLIIQGSRPAFRELDNIIRMLDRRREQVYIEADIIDINIGSGLSVGTSWLAGARVGNDKFNVPFGWKPQGVVPFTLQTKTDNSTPTAAAEIFKNAVPAQSILGVMGGPTINIGGMQLSPGAFIFALKNDSNANVLQTPSILVADNEEALFEATDTEHLMITGIDPTTKLSSTRMEKLDAVLSLKIKPQISRAEFVSMDLGIKADSFGRRGSDNRPEQTNKRTSNTKVTVQNQQTIVISGLQRDIEIDGKDKVPLLGDLPIIGWLFRSSSTTKQKTTLTVFITPYIVRSSEDLQKIYEKKTRERDEFLRNFYGEDFRKKEVFKRLPSMEQGNVPPASAVTPAPSDSTAVPAVTPAGSNKNDSDVIYPSEDPNPIVVPGGGGGGGGGSTGGMSGGSMGGSNGGGSEFVPPPPPPPPTGGGGASDIPPPLEPFQENP